MKPEDEMLFNEDMFDHKDEMILSFSTEFDDFTVQYLARVEAAKRDMPVLFHSRIDGALGPLRNNSPQV